MNLLKRISKGLLLTSVIYCLAIATASAKIYTLTLVGPGDGNYSVDFDNTGIEQCGPVSPPSNPAINIPGSSSGADLDESVGFCVRVAAVNFNDGKNPPNQITGNYVRGVEGSITDDSADPEAVVMTFAWAPATNPSNDTRTYSVDDNGTLSGGTYAIYSVPEPGTLAIFALGGAALFWSRRKR